MAISPTRLRGIQMPLAAMFARTVQFAMGAVLFGAGLVKAAEPGELMEAARFLLPIGPAGAWAFLGTAILLELLLGATMLAGLAARGTLFLATVLSVVFLGWAISLEFLGAEVGCGCGTTRLLGISSANRLASIIVSGSMLLLAASAFAVLTVSKSKNNKGNLE